MIKKILALLLCMAVVLAAAACTSSNSSVASDDSSSSSETEIPSNTDQPEDESEQDTSPVSPIVLGDGAPGTGEKTKAAFTDLYDLENRTFSLKMRISDATGAQDFKMDVTMAVSGNKLFVDMNGDMMKAAVLFDGTTPYNLMPTSKRYMIADDVEGFNPDAMLDDMFGNMHKDQLEDKEFTEGSATIDGVEYDYEAYMDESGQTCFFFIPGTPEFKFMSSTTGELIEILEYGNDVEDSVFVLPADYTELTQEEVDNMSFEELMEIMGMS